MEIVYWGTGAAEGVPAVFCNCALCQKARALGPKEVRTRAQMLIDGRLLVDLGPDTYLHSLQYGTNLMDIRHILVTHSHSDHFYAEDLVFRAEPYGHGGLQAPATLYGNEKTHRILNLVQQMYSDTDSFGLCTQFRQIEAFRPFVAGAYIVTPLPADHDVNEACFLFDIFSKRDGKRLLYANDSFTFLPQTLRYLRGRRFDLISLDCTMGTKPSASSHMSLPLCAALARRLREQGTADDGTVFVLTHFSHNCGMLHSELRAAAEKEGFVAACDGLHLTL